MKRSPTSSASSLWRSATSTASTADAGRVPTLDVDHNVRCHDATPSTNRWMYGKTTSVKTADDINPPITVSASG